MTGATARAVLAPRAPAPVLQRRCACGAKREDECKECKAKRVQRLPAGTNAAHGTSVPPIVHGVLRGPGRPLDASTREWFEERFGRDFSDVRIHADDTAAVSARAVNALAYTSGPNIVFGAGHYAPGSDHGRRLLAHELTHVLQQRTTPAAGGINTPGDAAEREADRNANCLGSPAVLSFSASPSLVSRQSSGEGGTTATFTGPSGPPGCTLDQHRVIEPAVGEAQRWLSRAATALGGYAAAPAATANSSARAALQRHFNTADPAVAIRLQGRLDTIRTDMTGRDPFTSECHGPEDPFCATSAAYVPGSNQNMVVFCPPFFGATSRAQQAGALIHEMAHALLRLRISDRAFEADRLRPMLSTAEALDNAESHAQLAQELGTGRVAAPSAPRDEIKECPPETEPLVREAVARAQRWNRDAEVNATETNPAMIADNAPFFTTHLGDASPATRSAARQVYSNMDRRLRSPIDVVCDTQTASECSSRQAYKKPASSNERRGIGIGAAIGGLLGAIAGVAAGIATASAFVGLGVGFGVFGLGLIIGLIAGRATSTPDQVHVCTTWRSQASDDRTESLLAAIYETYGGLNVQQSQRHSALARALHHRYIGPPERI